MKTISITSALLTGMFCSVFALTVDAVLDMVGMLAVAGIAATSGFLGSLFSQVVTKNKVR